MCTEQPAYKNINNSPLSPSVSQPVVTDPLIALQLHELLDQSGYIKITNSINAIAAHKRGTFSVGIKGNNRLLETLLRLFFLVNQWLMMWHKRFCSP